MLITQQDLPPGYVLFDSALLERPDDVEGAEIPDVEVPMEDIAVSPPECGAMSPGEQTHPATSLLTGGWAVDADTGNMYVLSIVVGEGSANVGAIPQHLEQCSTVAVSALGVTSTARTSAYEPPPSSADESAGLAVTTTDGDGNRTATVMLIARVGELNVVASLTDTESGEVDQLSDLGEFEQTFVTQVHRVKELA
ncbi:hypothetical protein [Rhodococcus tibetensis]|uniref:Lipoprotein LpqN n=1 Tax=Rhodococcus tibetensis TaxID=2965064 RepID=A0ABT1Q860_9NOCA|nr:hypothetical protein [Rhodococcus sp. FXJ9.536]MCQ4118424.1 hypothetical protein [Rhodococcus sp. FXJ9.536]